MGYNAAACLALWDTTEEVFLCCGIQRRRFSSIVGYNSGDFPPLWDITENNLRMVGNFSCIVSHNVIDYVLLRDTAQEVILRCIPQRRCFSSIVSIVAYGANRRTRETLAPPIGEAGRIRSANMKFSQIFFTFSALCLLAEYES